MEIKLAKTAGFCFGVKRAVDTVYKEAEKNKETIYTFGPIIHNEQVVEDLEKNGVYVVNTIEELKRLKAGTTQKMILNMITTASMVRSGKAYQNLMVDVVQSCDKLCVRIENIVMDATGVSREEARAAIDEADQSAKVAITKILTGTDVATAKELLEQAKGHVRVAIQLAQSK